VCWRRCWPAGPGLTAAAITGACRVIERFQQHVDEYFADLRSRADRPLALSTLRAYTDRLSALKIGPQLDADQQDGLPV
jgi:hypothetical protein